MFLGGIMWPKFQVWALKKACKKIAPNRIAMSGEECESNDFYSSRIKLGEVSALIRGLDSDILQLLKYNPETEICDIEDEININEVDFNKVEIRYYLHSYYTSYVGINPFIFNCITKKDYVKIKLKRAFNSVSQSLFNHRELQIKPRYELLSYLINNYGISRSEFSITSLMSGIYSLRSFGHPDRETCQSKLRMYIDSFIESGEVSNTQSGFKVNGKAIVTLELFQTEERHHKDSVRLQYGMIILTLFLAMFAAVQAGLIKLKPFIDFS